MTVVVHPADTRDVPAGEAVFLPVIPTADAPDVSGYAEAGTLLLPYTEGNIATGDPVGDADKVAALLDALDLNRNPAPPVAIRLDSEHVRENLATAMPYLTNWADRINARGYAPWIEAQPDVIWEAARYGARFAGCLPIAFEPTDGPAPEDVTNVPGLPADTYAGGRAYTYGTNGETIAADGVLATASIQLEVNQPATPGGDWGGLPAQADTWPAGEPEWASKLSEQLAAIHDELADLKLTLVDQGLPPAETTTTPDPALSDSGGTSPAASPDPAVDQADPAGEPAGQHAAADPQPEPGA